MRFVIGGLVVLVWAWSTGRLVGFRVARDEWRPLVIVGLILGAQISLLNIGTSLTSASHSAVLLNLYAVHTVVFAHFMIPGDRLSARTLLGTLIGYSGIVVLLARRGGGGDTTLAGDAIMLLSGIALGLRTVYLARTVQRLDPAKLLLAQTVFGLVVFLAGSLAFETRATVWTWRLAIAIGFQGLVIAGFNFIANLWLLKHYRPSVLAGFFLTQPIFGVIAANLVTGDPLTVELLVASGAVAVGIGLTSR